MKKSFGRLLYNDLITCPENLQKEIGKDLFILIEQFRNISTQQSLNDKNLEKIFLKGNLVKKIIRI